MSGVDLVGTPKLVVDVRLSRDTPEVSWNELSPIPAFHTDTHLSGLSFHGTSSAKPFQAWPEVLSQLFVQAG